MDRTQLRTAQVSASHQKPNTLQLYIMNHLDYISLDIYAKKDCRYLLRFECLESMPSCDLLSAGFSEEV